MLINDHSLPVLVLGRVEDALAAHEREVVAQLDPAVAALHHGLDLRAVDDHALALPYALHRVLDGARLDAPETKELSVQILITFRTTKPPDCLIHTVLSPYRIGTAGMAELRDKVRHPRLLYYTGSLIHKVLVTVFPWRLPLAGWQN